MSKGIPLGLVRFYRQALDWLFPPRCAGCKRLGEHWCVDCRSRVRKIEALFCLSCGFPLVGSEDCPACSQRRFAFDSARSWARYEGEWRRAILSLKDRRNENFGAELAKVLVVLFKAQDWKVDFVVSVPLAPQHFRAREYNQVELLAQPFAETTGLAAPPKLMLRLRETHSQVGLNPQERRANVRGAFIADGSQVAGSSVLILDDILTTGATLDAAALALKKAGARYVYALTLARTIMKGEPTFLVR